MLCSDSFRRYPHVTTLRNRWQLREAKNRLSEIVRLAESDGPQIITVNGKDAVLGVSAAEYRNDSPQTQAQPGLTLYELSRPWADTIGDIDLDFERCGVPTLESWHE